MSWLSDRWGNGGPFGTLLGAVQGKKSSVNALKGDLSNSIKDSADIVAPFTGPWAPLVAGVGNATSALIAPGGNIGQGAKAGALGAAGGEAGYLLGSALGAGGAATSNGSAGLGASASPQDLGLGASDLPAVGMASTPAYSDVASALGVQAPPSLGGDATDAMGAASGSSPWSDSAGASPTQIPLAQTGMGQGPDSAPLTAPTQADPLGTASRAAAPSPVSGNAVQTAQNAAQGGNQKGLLGNVLSTLGKIPPNLAGQALTAIGNAPLNEARAKQIALENQLYQQQIAKFQSLDPLRQALANAFQQRLQNPSPVAPNPYTKLPVAPNPYVSGGG